MGLSNAPAAKRALYDALKAELAPVGVWHSAPNTDHPGNENVVVGKSLSTRNGALSAPSTAP
jgi:hypothetical protein